MNIRELMGILARGLATITDGRLTAEILEHSSPGNIGFVVLEWADRPPSARYLLFEGHADRDFKQLGQVEVPEPEPEPDDDPADDPQFQVGALVRHKASKVEGVIKRIHKGRGVLCALSIDFRTTIEYVSGNLLELVPQLCPNCGADAMVCVACKLPKADVVASAIPRQSERNVDHPYSSTPGT